MILANVRSRLTREDAQLVVRLVARGSGRALDDAESTLADQGIDPLLDDPRLQEGLLDLRQGSHASLPLFSYVIVRSALLKAGEKHQIEKTGEKLSGFFIAPLDVKAFYEAIAAGDEKKAEALASKLPKDAWSFILLLRGEELTFSKARIIMREGTICGDYPELSAGSVTVDRKSSTVRIALKVSRDGKLSDFVGNGEYVWTIKPAP